MAEAAKKRLRKDFRNLQVYSKVGMQFLFFILHIANPQILCIFRGGLPAVKCGRKSD
jgi:hypothetical protein